MMVGGGCFRRSGCRWGRRCSAGKRWWRGERREGAGQKWRGSGTWGRTARGGGGEWPPCLCASCGKRAARGARLTYCCPLLTRGPRARVSATESQRIGTEKERDNDVADWSHWWFLTRVYWVGLGLANPARDRRFHWVTRQYSPAFQKPTAAVAHADDGGGDNNNMITCLVVKESQSH
jgi:hypothetical protein